MEFTESTWRDRTTEKLKQMKNWLKKGDAPFITYATVAGLSLWPLVEAAATSPSGQLLPVYLYVALGSVASGVGSNLIAEQLQRWRDQAEDVTESEVMQWIQENVETQTEIREALDDILESFNAFLEAETELEAEDRNWFEQKLRQEMSALGNLPRFEATLAEGSALATGDGATAVAKGGVAARDVSGTIVTGNENYIQTTIIHQYREWHVPLPDDLAKLRENYYQYLIEELKDHTIRGFAPQVGGRVLSLPLAKIFLPLEAVEGRPALSEYAEQDLRKQLKAEIDWRRSRQDMEKRFAQLQAKQATQKPMNLADLLENQRAVLLGDPGSGKTTVTRYITYALAAQDWQYIGSGVRGLTPVLVRIASFAKVLEQERRLHIIDYIEKILTSKPEFGRFLRHMITEGHCLIILDGLDEVEVNLRREVTERIRTMVASYGQNRFLVTSRIIGYEQSPLTSNFTHATLRDLSGDDQARFVKLWYEAIESELASGNQLQDEAEHLITALKEKPQISRLAASPLLLTIMVLMHWRGVRLPSRRVQVYESATDTLIEYWRSQPGVESLDALEIKAILAPIAHYILSSNVGGVISEQELLPAPVYGY